MVYTDAAQMAKDAQVKELWLTHFSPAMLNPKEHLGLARDLFPNTHAGHNIKTTTIRFEEE